MQFMQCAMRSSSCPDVIFMDNYMPNMNGIEATQEIRRMGYAGMIVAVTGSVLPDEVEAFLRAGADRVMSKPLDMSALRAVLQGL